MDIKSLFCNGKFIAERIIVIGPPGSGKTYFSEIIKNYFEGPMIHIDNVLWQNNLIPLSTEELRNHINKIIQTDKWIIDGTYLKLLPDRIKRASLIFYLDIPINVCIESINARREKETDIHGCEDYEGFINYVKKYDNVNKPLIEKMLLENYDKEIVRFKSRNEVNAFISDCFNLLKINNIFS